MTYRRGGRGLLALLLAAGLAACGGAAPPLAGDLLSAPTQLNFAGRLVRLEAQPTLSGAQLTVPVQFRAVRSPLPALTPQAVYVLTDAGVWSAPLSARSRRACTPGACLQVTGSAAGQQVRAGEAVQVVVQVRDTRGRLFWLRDTQVRVTGR